MRNNGRSQPIKKESRFSFHKRIPYERILQIIPAEQPSGTYFLSTTAGESARAFVSHSLPPPFKINPLLRMLKRATKGTLSEAFLYLSLFFKTHRSRYYELLQAVRTRGAWQEWILFFLQAMEETAGEAAETVRKLIGVFAEDR